MADTPFKNAPILSLPELASRMGEFYKAAEQFNSGFFFESHETLEDLWMVTPWPERRFFQGVIQLAAAFVHFARREYPGVLTLLDASSEKLREFTPEQFGVETTFLIADIDRVRSNIVALGPDHFLELPDAELPRIQYRR